MSRAVHVETNGRQSAANVGVAAGLCSRVGLRNDDVTRRPRATCHRVCTGVRACGQMGMCVQAELRVEVSERVSTSSTAPTAATRVHSFGCAPNVHGSARVLQCPWQSQATPCSLPRTSTATSAASPLVGVAPARCRRLCTPTCTKRRKKPHGRSTSIKTAQQRRSNSWVHEKEARRVAARLAWAWPHMAKCLAHAQMSVPRLTSSAAWVWPASHWGTHAQGARVCVYVWLQDAQCSLRTMPKHVHRVRRRARAVCPTHRPAVTAVVAVRVLAPVAVGARRFATLVPPAARTGAAALATATAAVCCAGAAAATFALRRPRADACVRRSRQHPHPRSSRASEATALAAVLPRRHPLPSCPAAGQLRRRCPRAQGEGHCVLPLPPPRAEAQQWAADNEQRPQEDGHAQAPMQPWWGWGWLQTNPPWCQRTSSVAATAAVAVAARAAACHKACRSGKWCPRFIECAPGWHSPAAPMHVACACGSRNSRVIQLQANKLAALQLARRTAAAARPSASATAARSRGVVLVGHTGAAAAAAATTACQFPEHATTAQARMNQRPNHPSMIFTCTCMCTRAR